MSPDCCPCRDVSAPVLLGWGTRCGDRAAFKNERFVVSFSPAVKHTLYSDLTPIKPSLVTLRRTSVRQKAPEVVGCGFEGVSAASEPAGVCWEDEVLQAEELGSAQVTGV